MSHFIFGSIILLKNRDFIQLATIKTEAIHNITKFQYATLIVLSGGRLPILQNPVTKVAVTNKNPIIAQKRITLIFT